MKQKMKPRDEQERPIYKVKPKTKSIIEIILIDRTIIIESTKEIEDLQALWKRKKRAIKEKMETELPSRAERTITFTPEELGEETFLDIDIDVITAYLVTRIQD